MEMWDVYDAQGNATGATIPRGGVLREGEYHLTASLWVINSHGELLIQKRAATKRIHPGKWGVTAGSVVAGECSVQGCLREAREEIGLELDVSDITLLARTFSRETIFDDYAIVRDFSLSDAVLQPDEVSAVRWANIDDVKALFNDGAFMLSDIADLDNVIAFIDARVRR